MLKLPREGGEITYKKLKTWMATGWKRRKILLRWQLTTLIVCLMQVNALKMDECLNTVLHKVTPDMQQILSSEFTADEIKTALFQMELTKAPGPSGMNALFYQKFWHVVGDSVIVVVLDYLNSGLMVPKINHTNIVLVPKVKSLEKMSDF